MKKKQKYEVPRTRARCYFFAWDLISTHEMETRSAMLDAPCSAAAELKPLHAALQRGFTLATNLAARNEVPPSDRQIALSEKCITKSCFSRQNTAYLGQNALPAIFAGSQDKTADNRRIELAAYPQSAVRKRCGTVKVCFERERKTRKSRMASKRKSRKMS